jgi:DNA repair protein SbcC/Rad50
MIIKSIKLSNTRSYLKQNIEFPNGTFLLSGDIGSGKSTILLAIEFALFGISKGLLSGEALLRHGKQSGYVELAFSLRDSNNKDREVVIRRNLKRNKDSIRQSEGFIIMDGIKQACTAEELRAKILGLVGYPKELLKKSKGLIYRFTVYTPQEEMKRILFEDPNLRLDTLRRVFQIEKYKLIKESSSVVMQGLREKKKELSARIEDLPDKKKQFKEMSAEMGKAEKKLKVLVPVIEHIEKTLTEKQDNLKTLEEKTKQLNILKNQLAATEAVLVEKNNSVKSKEIEITTAKTELSELKSITKDSSLQIEKLSLGISQLKTYFSSLLKETERKNTVSGQLNSEEKTFAEISSELSKLEGLKSLSKQIKDKISGLATCPTCYQPVTDQHKHKILADEDSKITDTNSKIAIILQKKTDSENKKTELKKQLVELQEKETKSAALSSELKSYIDFAQQTGIEASKINPYIGEIGNPKPIIESLLAARKNLESSKEKTFMISEKEKRIKLLEESISEIKSELITLIKKKEEISTNTASFSDLQSQTEKLQAEIKKTNEERISVMMQKASFEKEKESIENSTKILTEEIKKKEFAKKQLEETDNINYWLGEMFVNLVSVIERHVMMKIHQEFNELFREWFVMLMGDETLTAKVDENFTPVVEANGFEIPVENLSGGEKTSCALAYRLALNKVINDLVSTIKTKDLIILDEPTDGFSTAQLDKLRDVLTQLNLNQVIIVSHEERIESFVQNVIRIQKEQHVSKVVE